MESKKADVFVGLPENLKIGEFPVPVRKLALKMQNYNQESRSADSGQHLVSGHHNSWNWPPPAFPPGQRLSFYNPWAWPFPPNPYQWIPRPALPVDLDQANQWIPPTSINQHVDVLGRYRSSSPAGNRSNDENSLK